ncbi:uncharacterized protein LOC141614518 [Silene latifolia]|uniref:uncharacterized protein LOC141614518 n=1 Tax=Silene latifolia TaxID=37657 RepID=UPI003D773036
MSTAFNPGIDGQTEITIQTLENMLRACVLEFGGSWEEREKIRAAQDRQKSYADLKRSEIEFAVEDKVLLKVSPMKRVMRFDRIGEVAYRLAPPPALARVYNVFHVSQLRKYVSDPNLVLEVETVELDENLSYEEVAKEILDKKLRRNRNCEVILVKVLWSNHNVEEAT